MILIAIYFAFLVVSTFVGFRFVRWVARRSLPVRDGRLRTLRFLFWWLASASVSVSVVMVVLILALLQFFVPGFEKLGNADTLPVLTIIPLGVSYVCALGIGWGLQFDGAKKGDMLGT